MGNKLKFIIRLCFLLLPLAADAQVTMKAAPAVYKGFFVMMPANYQGNLGGLTGANSICLRDLMAYQWMGKLSAHLDSSHVFAWLCDDTTCNNLNATTTYYFAYAGKPAIGGQSFVTDAMGLGPNDSSSWATSATFDTVGLFYWGGRTGYTVTTWAVSPQTGSTCTNWTTNAGGANKGEYGLNTSTNQGRWFNGTIVCSSMANMVCYVNP